MDELRVAERNGKLNSSESVDPTYERRRRFEKIFFDHYDVVLSYAVSRADVETARDVAADTFLVAWRRLDVVPDEPRAWLIAVARRVLADHRRSTARRGSLVDKVSRERGPGDALPEEAAVTRDQILRAWGALSSSDREVLRLVAWDGLSGREAAWVLGCTRAGFAVRLHRARRRFESLLAAEELDGGEVEPTQREPMILEAHEIARPHDERNDRRRPRAASARETSAIDDPRREIR